MTISTRAMRWDAAKKILSACASDVALPAGCFPGELQVASHRTGDTRCFKRARFLADGDEVGAVQYRHGDMMLLLFND